MFTIVLNDNKMKVSFHKNKHRFKDLFCIMNTCTCMFDLYDQVFTICHLTSCVHSRETLPDWWVSLSKMGLREFEQVDCLNQSPN